jgi:hypothetical protein
MKRHIIIAFIAGLYAWALCAFRPPIPKSGSELIALQVAATFVSAFIWGAASIILKLPTFKNWIFWGMASPFVGLPIVLSLVGGPKIGLLQGFQISVFLGWLLIPGGVIMALLAHFISLMTSPQKPLKKKQ